MKDTVSTPESSNDRQDLQLTWQLWQRECLQAWQDMQQEIEQGKPKHPAVTARA